jgi:hypothetical protein
VAFRPVIGLKDAVGGGVVGLLFTASNPMLSIDDGKRRPMTRTLVIVIGVETPMFRICSVVNESRVVYIPDFVSIDIYFRQWNSSHFDDSSHNCSEPGALCCYYNQQRFENLI